MFENIPKIFNTIIKKKFDKMGEIFSKIGENYVHYFLVVEPKKIGATFMGRRVR